MSDFPDIIPHKEKKLIWATFIPSRQPEFKIHSSEGLAHSALGYRNFSEEKAKYRLEDVGWVKVWEYFPPTVCRCGRAFETARYYRKYNSDPTYTGPKWSEMPICNVCHEEIKTKKRQADEEKRELAQLAALKAKYGN